MFTAKISWIFVQAFKKYRKNEGLKRFGGNSRSGVCGRSGTAEGNEVPSLARRHLAVSRWREQIGRSVWTLRFAGSIPVARCGFPL